MMKILMVTTMTLLSLVTARPPSSNCTNPDSTLVYDNISSTHNTTTGGDTNIHDTTLNYDNVPNSANSITTPTKRVLYDYRTIVPKGYYVVGALLLISLMAMFTCFWIHIVLRFVYIIRTL
ncbi:surface-associated interspersed protein [Homarus gammarus nudivirus]|uniref:Surface-associated interspersed protein n=1 Tax=Homarus gammarus nudivirus TaxID=2509616 RepID=A0A411HB84_9VIRU|nr:surface-associated interspersed protein [Homarus gammarus nudivirus]QBB28649.1 surface-associated interspersed protein [Homarus gammarus nudivirus]